MGMGLGIFEELRRERRELQAKIEAIDQMMAVYAPGEMDAAGNTRAAPATKGLNPSAFLTESRSHVLRDR